MKAKSTEQHIWWSDMSLLPVSIIFNVFFFSFCFLLGQVSILITFCPVPPTHMQSPNPLTCKKLTALYLPYTSPSSEQVFEATRSPDHLTYFIKNT